MRIIKKILIWKWHLLFLCVLTVVILGIYFRPLYPAYFSLENIKQPALISHGGPIDGNTYTNSYDALLRAVKKGYQLIEVDMMLSSDGVIFGAHDLEQFNKLTGHSEKKDLPNLEEIKSRKILDKYDVLTVDNINKVFGEDPSLYLITDKLKDFDAILKQLNFPNANERVLVEVFGFKNYKKALRKGIKYPMLCIWSSEQLKKTMARIREKQITMITIPVHVIEEEPQLLEEVHSLGVVVFSFSTDNAEFIKENLNKRVTGFYTDWVMPNDIQSN